MAKLASLFATAPRELTIIIAKDSEAFGIAVLHRGEAVAFLSPAEADKTAAELRTLAKIARRPGQCPELAA